MANTLSQFGAQSATFTVPTVGGNNGTLTVIDWAGLPNGKLKDLMNKAYGAGDPFVADFSLFFAAMADAGFSCSTVHQNGSTAHNDFLTLSLDASGYPVVGIVTADVGAFIARLQVSYSASE